MFISIISTVDSTKKHAQIPGNYILYGDTT